MKKIIVFGIGKYYKKRHRELISFSQIEILALTDNDSTFWGKEMNGIKIIPPSSIIDFSFDAVLIMSIYGEEIKSQLIGLGVDKKKIIIWEHLRAEMCRGKVEWINKTDISNNKKVLIITCELNYNGGSLAAIYAALALKKCGFSVILASCSGNQTFIEEIIQQDVGVVICGGLPYVYEEEEIFIRQFDIVIVNTFQMIECACEVNMIRPTLWWIHEPSGSYEYNLWRYSDYYIENSRQVMTYAVSKVARNNFNQFMPIYTERILHYGIPDNSLEESKIERNKNALIFAIIGSLSPIKGQDIFLEAAKQIEDKEVEFWIIGTIGESEFSKKIIKMSNGIVSVNMFGLLTREEIYNLFPQIDVVVSASREDCLPIVITEGLMFGKVCIITDVIGTSDYIQDGINGFIVPKGNINALKEKMEWIIFNREKCKTIGANARETYEKYFSMEVFGKNLENALIETEAKWKIMKLDGLHRIE